MRFSAVLVLAVSASAVLAAFGRPGQRAGVAKLPASKSTAQAAQRNASGSQPNALSIRVVAYQIDARLDPAKKTIEATEALTYLNLTGQPQQTFPFHLYLNAFQPKSTFMTEVRMGGTRGTGPEAGWDPEHYGAIEVRSLAVDGMGDLTNQMQFIQPDDRNADDHTVFQVTLPKPVPPKALVTFRMVFHDQLPEVVERTGYKRDFFMVGQWFPKVGVWWHRAWNCHQFHATTEFFADFGTFNVKVTVPRNYILGAAGDEVSGEDNPDGTRTMTYHAEDTHDFSWTASPDFTEVEDSWTGPNRRVKIHLLMSPGHVRQTGRYLQAIKGTLDTFDRWYGLYPYDRITMVDPPEGALDAGRMEYPTLITGGTSWFEPREFREIELVTEHEFGHQYWYGMVATNEFEEAWLDEGINSYTEAKVIDALYGEGHSAINLWGATLDDAELLRLDYMSEADTDPLTRFAYHFMSSGSYGGVTYGKTAMVLLTLEGMIGEVTMRNALHAYFEQYKFTHPTGTDFLKTIQEVSGQDLSWYFNQAVSGTNVLDYEVLGVRSDRADWYLKNQPPEKKGQTLYRDTALVHRKGDFIFPVETQIRFDDGETVREKWDGRDRWVRYEYMKKAKIVSVEVDPDHKVLLDKDCFNNSYTAAPHEGATHKLEAFWLFLSEGFAQLVSFLV
jgi:hypothetical protein